MYDYRGKILMRILTFQDRTDTPPTMVFDVGKDWDIVLNLRDNVVVRWPKNLFKTIELVVEELQKNQERAGHLPMEEW